MAVAGKLGLPGKYIKVTTSIGPRWQPFCFFNLVAFMFVFLALCVTFPLLILSVCITECTFVTCLLINQSINQMKRVTWPLLLTTIARCHAGVLNSAAGIDITSRHIFSYSKQTSPLSPSSEAVGMRLSFNLVDVYMKLTVNVY